MNNKYGFGKLEYTCILIRSVIFQIFLYSWVVFVLAICYPSIFISRKILLKIFSFLTKSALFLMKYILRISCNFENLEIFEQVEKKFGPYVIACKHQSGFETVIFSTILKDFNIVAKEEMKKVPLIGAYMKNLKFIFIDRNAGKKALEILIKKGRDSMDEKRPLIIFPEGSRAEFGQKGKYHAGVAFLYKSLGVPIVPVAINAGAVWQKKSIIKFPGVITLRVLQPIEPGLEISEVMKVIEDTIEDACKEIGNGVKKTNI